jgi:hypothetical protein
MIYVSDITTPANTTKAQPLSTEVKIANGLVYKLEIVFPPGPYGLVGVAIYDGPHQVWPVHLNTYFRGDNISMSFDDLYLKEIPPFNFTIKTYNLDDIYEHEVIVRIGMVSKDVFLARFLPSIGYEDFVKRLKALSEEQQKAYEEKNQEILDHPINWLPK